MPYFTRRMQNRRFRRMTEWQEEAKRIEQLKQEQTNPNTKQEQTHERDSEDRIR